MNSSSMMLLPFTWISKCEQSCLVEDILLCLPSIGYKSPFNWHIVIQHFALQGVLNSSPSFEMRGLCVIVLCSCCNMFHWGSCRKETNDLARARSSLSIIRQTMFVCLRNSVFPSGKSCCVRRLLAKDKIAGVSSITDPSVHIGRGLLRKILPCETFHLTSPAPKEKGLGSRLLSMSRRWHTSRWKIDCTTRQQVRLRHGARANFSQHIARVEIQYHQPTVCCLFKTVGWDDWRLKLQWCPVFGWGVANICTKMLEGIQCLSVFDPTAASVGKQLLREAFVG